MKLLSRSEEIILLTVWRLQKDAYGMSIRREAARVTGKTWSFGSIYAPLNRLLKKGYVRSIEGEPTPERGGRRKIYYRLTPSGKKALVEIQKVSDALWQGVPSLLPNRS